MRVSAGAIYNLPVRLALAQLESSVEVSAAAVTVETTSTTLTSVLGLPLDPVEEYSAQTQAAAETGRNPGGAVNLIIKSGTNQPHGSGYYYNRNEALSALSPFAPVDSPKNKLQNEHFGVSVGGPILAVRRRPSDR